MSLEAPAEAPVASRATEPDRRAGPGCDAAWLAAATWGYLALPLVVFLIAWVRWPLALVALAGLAVALARAMPRRPPADRERPRPPSARVLLRESAILTAVGAVIALNGTGGFGIQTWDWLKHTAILRDLIDAPWPVVHQVGEERVALVYYLAWYLPPALVGKLLGWVPAHAAQLAWTVAGAWLCVGWLRRLGAARWWLALLVFVLFSGLDALGALLLPRFPGAPPIQADFDLEWWARWWAYESNVSHLAYAPHQALGGWLFTSLLLEGRRRAGRTLPFPLLPLLAVGLLWSPFAVLGALAFLGVESALRRDPARLLRDLVATTNLAAAPPLLLVVAYFAARLAPPVVLDGYRPETVLGSLAWTVERGPLPSVLGTAAWFLLVEVLALAVAAWWALRGDREQRRGLVAAACVLVALPWVSYGFYNDLAIRASLPALFVLQVALLAALARWRDRRRAAAVTLALALLGALYPANQLRLRALAVWERRELILVPSRASTPDLFEQQLAAPEGFFFVGQYVGSAQAPFFRWLAAPTRPLPVRSAPDPKAR
jgi:hypothetical protein